MRYILTCLVLAVVCAYFYSPERFSEIINRPLSGKVVVPPKIQTEAEELKAPKSEEEKQHPLDSFLANTRENNLKNPAFVKLKQDAENGIADAQFILGNLFDRGYLIKEDDAQAVFWYQKAAEQDLAKAQNALGDMYKEGNMYDKDSPPQDYRQAIAWYKKAAEKGYSSAQNSLGTMYQDGLGVPKDDAIAVYWYREAAHRGDIYGQYNLANAYSSEGRGVKRDYIEAYAWANVVAAQDHITMSSSGEFLRDQYIRQHLSADGLSKAQELSRQYFQLYASPSSQFSSEDIKEAQLYKLYVLPLWPVPEEKKMEMYDLIEKQIQNAPYPVSQ